VATAAPVSHLGLPCALCRVIGHFSYSLDASKDCYRNWRRELKVTGREGENFKVKRDRGRKIKRETEREREREREISFKILVDDKK
jgi:hypothetical protein